MPLVAGRSFPMDLIPAQEDVIRLLRETGALRDGHFEYHEELHTDQHLETALAMRSYQNVKILSVALSRLVRSDIALRTVLPELSIVAATTAGLPIACGLADALRPKQLYWVERDDRNGPVHLPQFLLPAPGEKVLLVDNVLRSGRSLAEAAALLEAYGSEVLGIAILIHQPDSTAISFGQIPIHSLASLPAPRWSHRSQCAACRRGVPLERRTRERSLRQFAEAAATCAS